MKKKNLTLSIILSLIFGPFGLLYSSIAAGVIAIVFSILLGIALGLLGGNIGFEIETIIGLVVQPIIVAWGALIVKEKNCLIDSGESFNSEIDTKLLYDAVQFYLLSLALCFIIIAVLTQFNEDNFMQKSMFPSMVVTMLFLIAFVVASKRESSSIEREVQNQDD